MIALIFIVSLVVGLIYGSCGGRRISCLWWFHVTRGCEGCINELEFLPVLAAGSLMIFFYTNKVGLSFPRIPLSVECCMEILDFEYRLYVESCSFEFLLNSFDFYAKSVIYLISIGIDVYPLVTTRIRRIFLEELKMLLTPSVPLRPLGSRICSF